MIGCILTGHGSFAPGLMGALEMVAGEQEKFEVVPFLDGDSLSAFEEKLSECADRLSQDGQGVVIFTDLLGGTPFRTAMLAAQIREKVAVVAGTNLPMLLEGSLIREQFTEASGLADSLLEGAKDSIIHAHLELKEDDDTNAAQEEGI